MRLTKKTKLFRGYTRDFAITNVIGEMTYKLGQLENIEDELGLTLKQFFKEITKINPNWTTLYFKYNGKEYEIKERE